MSTADRMAVGAEVALHGTKGDVTGFNDEFVTVRVPRSRVTVIESPPEPGLYITADGQAVQIRTDDTKDTILAVLNRHGAMRRLTRMPSEVDVRAALNLPFYDDDLAEATRAIMDLLTTGMP